MSESWAQLDLVKAQRDVYRERVADLEDAILELRYQYAALEQENLDLVADIAELRFEAQCRHPSTGRDMR